MRKLLKEFNLEVFTNVEQTKKKYIENIDV